MSHTHYYPPSKPTFHFDRWTIGFLITFFVIGLATVLTAFFFVTSTVSFWKDANLPKFPFIGGTLATVQNAIAQIGNQIEEIINLATDPGKTEAAPPPVATPQPWDGDSRVTVLLMGLDYRDWQAGDVPRTDSMWLFTVDPKTKTAGMMSIPRDTWVAIPGFDWGKINMAYFYGEAYKTPGGGPALAAKTVENFMGVKVDYYVRVDFDAFVQFIDKLDGIYIDVPEEISVDPLGPGNTVVLEPGRQRVFGAVALGYARNRHTAGGDYDRMKRQLQVIMGIRDRVMEPGKMLNLISAAPHLYEILSKGLATNLELQQAIQLAWLAYQVPTENIKHATITPEQTYSSWSPQGWSIEVPIMDRIYALRDQVFSTDVASQPEQSEGGDGGGEQVSAPPQDQPAQVAVQNGTGTIGLAGHTSDYLKSEGFQIANPTDADGFYDQTMIIDYAGKPDTVNRLAELLHVDASRILNRNGEGAAVDVVVILGQDWVDNNPMP